jgi:hypothetical protein
MSLVTHFDESWSFNLVPSRNRDGFLPGLRSLRDLRGAPFFYLRDDNVGWRRRFQLRVGKDWFESGSQKVESGSIWAFV